MYKNFSPKKLEKIAEKCPKKGGKKIFKIFFLYKLPQVLGQVWDQKSKKKVEKKFRLGAIEENQFFWEKS